MTFLRLLNGFAACVTCLVLSSLPGIIHAQSNPQPQPATLKVVGDVRTPLALVPDDLKTMPRARVEVKGEEGRVTAYEGVLAGEILKRAGATLGADLRGSAMSTYVLASASDGYQVVFSLAELDPAMSSSEILVADTMDGKALAERQGPFRIVVPKDSRPARSIRMLERLEVVRLRK